MIIRFRVRFKLENETRRFWYFSDDPKETVEELVLRITESVASSLKGGQTRVVSKIDKYELEPWMEAHKVIRDGDLVV